MHNMKKKLAGLLSIVLIVVIVSVRLYRKNQRAQKKEEQQKEINRLYIQNQEFLKNEQEKNRKLANQRRLDSLDSIRKANFDAGMKKLKDAQKKIQEEIDKKEKKN